MSSDILAFKKGVLRDDRVRQALTLSLQRGDWFEIGKLIDSGPPSQRPLVDVGIFCTPTRDMHLAMTPSFPPDLEQLKKESRFLASLVPLRDVPFDQLPTSLPLSYRKASYFFRNTLVACYAPNVDFMDELGEYNLIQQGNRPTRTVTPAQQQSNITTGRHAATFVHKDDPLLPWFDVLKELLTLGCPRRTDLISQEPFVTVGYPGIAGMLGESLRRCGLVTFRQKWAYNRARPEEFHYRVYGELLPQCYPEGSPMHPSFGGMHSSAALTMCALLLAIFDPNFVLPNGSTLRTEAELMADNLGYWRCWAGVHFSSDTALFKDSGIAVELAMAVIRGQ